MSTKKERSKALVAKPRNPFIEKIAIPTNIVVREVKINGNFTLEGRQYEIISRSEFEAPTKLFNKKALKSSIISNKLSSDACRVLLYILTSVSPKATSFAMNKETMMDDLSFTASNYAYPLVELQEAGIIDKKDSGYYWLNPMYFFSGDRVKYFGKKSFLSEFGLSKTLKKELSKEDFVFSDLMFINKKIDKEYYLYDKYSNLQTIKRSELTWRNVNKPNEMYTEEDRYFTDYYVVNGVDNYGNNYELIKLIAKLDDKIDQLNDKLQKAKDSLKAKTVG